MGIIKIKEINWLPKRLRFFFHHENLAISTHKVKSEKCFEILALNDDKALTRIDFDGRITHYFKSSFASVGYEGLVKESVDLLISLVTTHCEDSPKKKYNHAFEISFTVDTDNPGDRVTRDELMRALKKKVAELEATGEILEAVGLPYDTYENY